MSKFLGPIHHWLHNKILRQEHLEIQWEERMKELSNAEVNQILITFDERFGQPQPYEALETSIDASNIHGWLQQRIQTAETRFAGKLTEVSKVNPNAVEMAETVYKLAAKESVADIKAAGMYSGDLQVAFKLLNNYVLEGMPCDHAGAVTDSQQDHLIWMNKNCLHQKYWNAVDGDVTNHYKLRDAFSEVFFKELDNLNYSRLVNEIGTQHTIQRM